MADAGTKLTPQQKIEMARKAIDGISRGDVNPERFSRDAVMRGSLMGEVRGRDAVVAALKKMPTMFEEFRQEPHAILADNDHVVAIINLKVKSGGQTTDASGGPDRARLLGCQLERRRRGGASRASCRHSEGAEASQTGLAIHRLHWRPLRDRWNGGRARQHRLAPELLRLVLGGRGGD